MYKVKLKIDNKSEIIEKEKLLTIGIITKNEPERLERCLKSLIPVREALDCEIIVTDTGSTDNTVEIAEKYSDKVIHFKWCDDFAAARNTGIDEAKGLWFMWIDSDEWIENPEPLIEFFESGKYKNYASANVSLVNLINKDEKLKSGVNAFRLLLLYKNFRFKGKIHEYINREHPEYFIDMLMHHDGYCFEDQYEKNKKHKRNIDLLVRDYSEDNENLRTISFLVEQYRFNGNYEKANEYCNKGLRIIENREIKMHSDKVYAINFIIFQSSNYLEMKKYYSAIQVLESLKDEDELLSSRFIDVYGILFIAYHKLENTENKLKYAEKYINYYSKKDEFDRTYSTAFFHQYDRPDILMMAISEYITNFKKTDRENLIESQIVKYITKIKELDSKLDSKLGMSNYILNIFNLLNKFKDYRFLSYVYVKMIENDSESDVELFENSILHYIAVNQKDEFSILIELSKINSDRQLVKWSKIFCMSKNNENEQVHSALARVLEEEIKNICIKSELIYIAVKSSLDFSLLRNNIDIFVSNIYVKSLITAKGDYLNNVIKYYHDMKITNSDTVFMYFIVSMIEGIGTENLNEKELMIIFNIYSDILPKIIHNIYNENFINESNINIYPPVFRFGYFIEKANEHKHNGNMYEYIRELKNALSHYKSMAKVIKNIVKKVEKEFDDNNKDSKEFRELTARIKRKVYELITSGEYNEASIIISQLQAIIPEDRELNELRIRIGRCD